MKKFPHPFRRLSLVSILMLVFNVLLLSKMFAQPTWQIQSDYFGTVNMQSQIRSMRGIALTRDNPNVSLYLGYIQGSSTSAVRKVKSAVHSTFGADAIIIGNYISGPPFTGTYPGTNPAYTGGATGVLEANLTNSNRTFRNLATDDRGNVYTPNGSATSNPEVRIYDAGLTTVQGSFLLTGMGSGRGVKVLKVGSTYYCYAVVATTGVGAIERWNVTNPAGPVLDVSWGKTTGGVNANGHINVATIPGGINGLLGLTVEDDGTLYVAAGLTNNDANATVIKISNNGDLQTAIKTTVPFAYDVAVFRSKLYVAKYNSSTSSIAVLNKSDLSSAGTLTTGISHPFVGDGDNGYSGIDISNDGRLFVVDQIYENRPGTTPYTPPVTSFNPSPTIMAGANIMFDRVLVSSPLVPTVVTTAATSVTNSSATLNGTVNANGSSTDVNFEYGPDITYGTPVAGTPSPVTGSSTTPVSADISLLSPNKTYHYRVNGVSSGGTTNGNDLTFTTLANVPGAPTVNNPTITTLDVAVNPNGNPANTQFAIHESTTNKYVQANGSLGAAAVWQTASAWGTKTVTGLTPGTTYTFEVKARNGDNIETAFGPSASGTTTALTSFYVNDSDPAGDHYTTAPGNDANIGTPSSPFATINHAISLASNGNTIFVDAGTYHESVLVNKQLTIKGSQAGVLGKGRSSAESILDPNSSAAHGFKVVTDNVTIDGFTITNSAAYPSASTERYGVVTIDKIAAGNFTGIIVKNNIITRQFKAVNFNYTDNFEISRNWLHGENDSYNYGCTWVSSYGTSSSNGLMTNNDLDGYNSAIEIQGALSQPVSNVTVSENRSTGSQYVFIGLQNSNVYRNSVLNVTVGTHVFIGGGCTNDVFSENFFDNGSSNGVRITNIGGGLNSNLTVTNNSITGHNNATFYEINVDPSAYTGTLSATCNWYGTTDPAVVASKISGPVTYSPFLTNGTDNEPATPGFQPVPGSCGGQAEFYVDDDQNTGDVYTPGATGNDANPGTATAPFRTIAHAIAVASPGDIIKVDAGTYSESTGPDKKLTFLGANATISPNTGSRNAESILTEVKAFSIATTSRVIIKGFKCTTTGGNPIDNYTAGAKITLEKNLLDGSIGLFFADADSLEIIDNRFKDLAAAAPEGIQVAGNYNGTTGTYMDVHDNSWINGQTTGMNLSNVRGIIYHNNFTGIPYYGILVANRDSLDIYENTFSGITNPGGSPTYGAGVRFFTPSPGLITTVRNNYFTNNAIAVAVRNSSGDGSLAGTTVHINNNSITGSTDANIKNQAAETLEATCNWYGTTDPAVISSKNSGPVTFVPFLTNGTDNAPATPGFQPVPGSCNGALICESPAHQAYSANTNTGNQAWRGELGMQFIVNNPGGILIKQLGAFDDGGNGITGLQSGGVRVAIFNRSSMTIVSGLNVVITGPGDHYTGNHRMVDLASPVTLPPGDYLIVAKGYHDGEKNGTGDFPPGDNGGGAITFGNVVAYGIDDPSGFSYPPIAYGGSTHAWNAGTFTFTTTGPCGGGPSNNANLSNLVLSQGTLTPPFAQNTTSYTASVPNGTSSITVTPTAADAGASITVNGTPVTSGTPSGSIPLAVGPNTITVVVTAQDGTTTKTYTVTVTRAGPGPSNNANLSNLVLSQGTLTPPFAQNTTSYTASVPNGTSSITVTPTAADAGASITVNGTPVTSGTPSGSIPLAVGPNTITVVVTAQDGTTTRTYTVTVTRAGPGPSNNANLSNLVLSQGTLTPPFAQNTTSYTASVPNGTASITVTPTAADAGASITVNGTPVTSGTPSGSIPLAVGPNTITVVVTAQDGTTTKTYTVTVTRAGPGPSNNANLSNLVLSQGTLTPPFAQNTTSYTASVPNGTSSITVTPTAADAGASITVNGTPVTSGTPSGSIPLAVGPNTITVVVTAQDGTTTKTYTVTVTRAAGGGSCESSPVQAYTTNLTDGNEPWQGELGMQFIVNNASGIVIKQLGAFDDGGNGITGLQSGGVRVAIFNRSTMTIVPGLNVVITGAGDHYTGNHRMVDLASPVTLPPGDYVIVAKGYNSDERTRSGSFTPGNTGGGAITFGNEVSYGPNNPAGFNYPVTAYGGDAHAWLAGTFVFTTTVPCGGPSNNANLSNLVLSQGTLTPPFAQNTTSYTASVPNGTSSITVTPTAADAGASITVNGTPVTSGTPSGSIALAVGPNTITVVVTAQDGTTTRTYTVTVTRAGPGPSNNANLSNLVLSQGTLTPPFAQNTTSYTASVPNGTASMTVTPTAADAGASITVNGTPVTSGTPSGSIALAVGPNTITVLVTAQDGTTTKTYTVTVTRAGPGPSNNANLSNLVLSQGTLTPPFAQNTTSYTASVPNGTSSITVTPTAADAGATITVNGTPVTSGTPSGSIALAVGPNTITVIVTAQDGTTTKTYTVTVTRAAGGGGGCESSPVQAYTTNLTDGNEPWQGELGMQFIVNNASGIIIKQLGAFDDGANGINGLQSGGVRVAIFNRSTMTIVPGLNIVISGFGDHYTGNHRMVDLASPVTLPPGDYVIVAKGYNSGERARSGSFTPGNTGGGAITFGNEVSYGPNDPAGFNYPVTAYGGDAHAWLAGTFVFTVPVACATLTKADARAETETIEQNDLKVSPNPTSGQFNLQLIDYGMKKVDIQIMDQNGRIVEQKTISLTGKTPLMNIPFNLTNRAAGMYFIRITGSDGVRTSKVVIQH